MLYYALIEFQAHIHHCDFSHLITYAKKIQHSGIDAIGDTLILVRDKGDSDDQILGCGAGLEDLVRWYASNAFHLDERSIIDFSAGEGGTGSVIEKANLLGEQLWNDGVHDEEGIRQAFQEWLKVNKLECRAGNSEDGHGGNEAGEVRFSRVVLDADELCR